MIHYPVGIGIRERRLINLNTIRSLGEVPRHIVEPLRKDAFNVPGAAIATVTELARVPFQFLGDGLADIVGHDRNPNGQTFTGRNARELGEGIRKLSPVKVISGALDVGTDWAFDVGRGIAGSETATRNSVQKTLAA